MFHLLTTICRLSGMVGCYKKDVTFILFIYGHWKHKVTLKLDYFLEAKVCKALQVLMTKRVIFSSKKVETLRLCSTSRNFLLHFDEIWAYFCFWFLRGGSPFYFCMNLLVATMREIAWHPVCSATKGSFQNSKPVKYGKPSQVVGGWGVKKYKIISHF